jgi:lysozyme
MINKEALDLIKKWEGFRATAYKDAVGIWTIGYGTTANAGVGIDPKAGMNISESQAESYLRAAVTKFGDSIRSKMTMQPNENEFGAMVSLAYNIGPGAFGKSSVLRLFNEDHKKEAADAFLLWNKAGGKVLRGLTNRRIEERALFLKDVSSLSSEKPNWLAVIIAAILRMIGGKR